MLEIKTSDADSNAKIIVVGVGGAGNNAVESRTLTRSFTSALTTK